MKHTKGPWKVIQATDVETLNGIIQCTNSSQAQLISAAPDLLEAAIDLMNQVNSGDGDHYISYFELEKAIKKAKGL